MTIIVTFQNGDSRKVVVSPEEYASVKEAYERMPNVEDVR